MKLNTIQQMMVDTDMLATRLEVNHDTEERAVVINPVWCDIGSHMVSAIDLHGQIQDVSVCEGCFDHFNDRWD